MGCLLSLSSIYYEYIDSEFDSNDYFDKNEKNYDVEKQVDEKQEEEHNEHNENLNIYTDRPFYDSKCPTPILLPLYTNQQNGNSKDC